MTGIARARDKMLTMIGGVLAGLFAGSILVPTIGFITSTLCAAIIGVGRSFTEVLTRQRRRGQSIVG